MNSDEILFKTIGELKESNHNIADSMTQIKNNLKILNDHNILHAQQNLSEHKTIAEKVQILGTKHWYLMIALLIIILVIMGYKEAATTLIF